jgi:hypothetical protein
MLKIQKLFFKLRDFYYDKMATVTFYRHSPHKIPFISETLCRIGRHDFELKKVLNKNNAELYCFYCGQIRNSGHFTSLGEK